MNYSRYFHYDPVTGDLLWKDRDAGDFKDARSHAIWRARFSGKVAGNKTLNIRGTPKCIRINLFEKSRKAHRIIWEMHNGPIPDGMEIDHIDLNPYNNTLSNLRLSTHGQNLFNQGRASHNTTGFKGVSLDKKSGSFVACISVNNRKRHIGSFATAEEAHAAYVLEATKLRGEFSRAA